MSLVGFLAWLAVPVGVLCVIDDWFRRPHRQAVAGVEAARDPPLIAFAYLALPLIVGAAVLHLLTAERLDFSAVLLSITVITGVVWWLDVALVRRRRVAAARAAGKDPTTIPEPGTVDYARSFFPVALAVLVLRSFIFEPFRIPSDSMMPTLLDGDFILVNKYAYGLRLPVINRKVVPIGEPQRGDVVVFRYPLDPSVNYIKRLVGLPGDRVEVRHDRLYVNGEAISFEVTGTYDDGCYINMQIATEKLGEHEHQTIFCPTPLYSAPVAPAQCNRSETRGHVCEGLDPAEIPQEWHTFSTRVPQGAYLMVGDNRDNSADGREWGFVPEDHLVGKATRIWFNWDLQRTGGPVWSRIGKPII